MIGAGSTAVGASALVGSGAVSQMSSGPRGVSVDVVDDDEGYIALQPRSDDPYDGQRNGNFADIGEDGKLYLDFTSDNPTSARSGDPEEGTGLGGKGVNPQSVYFFDGVFDIRNLANDTGSGVGEQDIWIENDELDELTFYHLKSGNRANIEGQSNSVDISPGDALPIGVKIDASDLESGDELEGDIQVHSKGGSSTTYGQDV
ncbi:DUF1102 domain-containing protein [Natronococcus sp. A-GB7]|uniref:DUF1102 domain-containing protein n=1 Tax=Natronococcus sp. A-GB7 TaxID=3037649 RepID=UPI00241C3470|nr:DUF1102 domain-containing protein [Natronococcus sp. A-GB7]MDG5817530.1 DUF1102 domain-containing protein [Natronococcus sp. A-GB7]